MRVLIYQNVSHTRQWSMYNSSAQIYNALLPIAKSRIIKAPRVMSLIFCGRFNKYATYIDVYLLGALILACLSIRADVVIAVDHAYTPALWLVAPRKRTTFVHDTIAMRQAKGKIGVAPRVGRFGKMYQNMIENALRQIPTLATNTLVQVEQLRESGVMGKLFEIGQSTIYKLVNFQERPSVLALEKPYLIHVGSDSWIKNKPYLIDILACLAEKMRSGCPDLVLAGRTDGKTIQYIFDRKLESKVHMICSPSLSTLASLMQGSVGLVMVSLDEGFGVPPLEALELGKPIFLSDIDIFRCIYDDAATYLPLDNAQEAAATLSDALERHCDRRRSIAKVLKRYELFEIQALIRIWITYAYKVSLLR